MIKITPTDSQKETEGTWTEYMGVKLKVARTSKPAYTSELARLAKPMKKSLDKGDASPEQMLKALCKAMSKHILVDWKGFIIDGEEVPYSPKTAYELLTNDTDCREQILEFANESANFYKEESDTIVGKS